MSDKNHLRSFFYDSSAKLQVRLTTWKQYGSNPKPFFSWVREQLVVSPKTRRILDVGCGTGQLLSEIRRMHLYISLTGVDLSLAMVMATKKNVSGISALEGDAEKLPFPGSRFDIVTAIHMLYHVPDQTKALKEMIRVTKKGGTVFITTTDYEIGSGLNKLHYEGLKKLSFPAFMRDTASYLRFAPDHAKQILSTLSVPWTIYLYKNDVLFTGVEPAMAYYQSAMMYRQSLGIDDERISQSKWNELYSFVSQGVAQSINNTGIFRMPGRVIGFKLMI